MVACKGTATSSLNPKDVVDPKSGEDLLSEPVSMGIIFNFTTQSVQGFGYPGLTEYPVTIKGTNDVKIVFDSQQTLSSPTTYPTTYIIGSLDRVTGYLQATRAEYDKNHKPLNVTTYELQCKPTQRMF